MNPHTTLLTDEARALLRDFEALSEDDRARILALVRGLRAVDEAGEVRLQRPVTPFRS